LIPVAVSIHTVTAWLFGTTLRPGWHSTIIGPDFVVGALYSGIAAVLTVMALFRSMFHLEKYITVEHFKKLSLLLLVSCFAYMYFVINEYLGPGYTSEGSERHLLAAIFHGPYAIQFWTMVVIGLFVPGAMLALPQFRTVKGIITASILVNVGMWLKRYVIVVPTLASPFMPLPTTAGSHLSYIPTWVEWTITASAFAASCLFYIIFSKIFPIISIWEVSESARDIRVVESGGRQEVVPCAP
jgi:Ni/Fe-hydrogenase subunit HybB-like protein